MPAVNWLPSRPRAPRDLTRVLEFRRPEPDRRLARRRSEDLDHGDIDSIRKAARACPLTGLKER